MVNYLVVFTLLRCQYPAVAHILSHFVNLVSGSKPGLKNIWRGRPRFELQIEARLQLWLHPRDCMFHPLAWLRTFSMQPNDNVIAPFKKIWFLVSRYHWCWLLVAVSRRLLLELFQSYTVISIYHQCYNREPATHVVFEGLATLHEQKINFPCIGGIPQVSILMFQWLAITIFKSATNKRIKIRQWSRFSELEKWKDRNDSVTHVSSIYSMLENSTKHCSFTAFPKRLIQFSEIEILSSFFTSHHERNFVVKCGGTPWCETNIVIGSMQKWRFIYADSQSYF